MYSYLVIGANWKMSSKTGYSKSDSFFSLFCFDLNSCQGVIWSIIHLYPENSLEGPLLRRVYGIFSLPNLCGIVCNKLHFYNSQETERLRPPFFLSKLLCEGRGLLERHVTRIAFKFEQWKNREKYRDTGEGERAEQDEVVSWYRNS